MRPSQPVTRGSNGLDLFARQTVPVFCRGVGPVQWHYEDGNGNGFEVVLRSRNF
jgi:hypothetical protein